MTNEEPPSSPHGSITVQRVGERVHIVLSGTIDVRNDRLVVDDPAFAEPVTRIVVDASDVTFMDSLGLSALLRLRHYASDGVQLVNPSTCVLRILELTGTEALFEIG